MLVFRGSEVYEPGQSPEDLQELTEKMMIWVGDLIQTGAHVASERLHRRGVQVYGREKAIQEVPFGMAAAIIGGCTIVQAKNIGEATEIAKKCPILGTNANIEIRQIQSL